MKPGISRRRFLHALTFALPVLPTLTLSGLARPLSLGLFQRYFKGSYAAWPGLWYLLSDETLGLGRKAIENVDFTCVIEVDPTTFPAKSRIIWDVPHTPPANAGVYGYLHLSFGDYDNTIVETPVTPLRVKDINSLTADVEYTYSRGDETASILLEFWLTSSPGKPEAKVAEVGFFLHTTEATRDYVESVEPIGAYTDSHGRDWTVVIDRNARAPFVMCMPTDRRSTNGVFDIQHLLQYLISLRILTGDEWFNGLAVGPEPHTGSGEILFAKFEVNVSGSMGRYGSEQPP